MSVRAHPGQQPLTTSRLYDVLRTSMSARPTPSAPVYTSDGALIGYAETSSGTEPVYVFTSPSQLHGVRVHPPFRVGGVQQGGGLVEGIGQALSDALGR